MMTLSEAQAKGRAFRQVFDRNKFLWGPEEGEPILAKDLTHAHLANIINWISDNYSSYGDEVYSFMVGEAKYRQLIGFASGEPYPQCGEDGRYRVVYP